MNKETIYPIIVFGSFSAFLLTFIYAIFRWAMADAGRRAKNGWLLAMLLVGVPLVTFIVRAIFRDYVPARVAASVELGVPLVSWLLWLVLRPSIKEPSTQTILAGRNTATSIWILIFCLLSSGYCMGVVWIAQLVDYPLYLAVPPESFPAYFAQFNESIVFPVIFALSMTWIISVALILNRPKEIPAWAAWTAAGLAMLGFIASAAFEFPYNKQLMAEGFNEVAINAKITGNWFRLVPWTIQAGLVAWMVNVVIKSRSNYTTPAK